MQTFSNRTDLFVRALSVAGGMSGRIGQAKQYLGEDRTLFSSSFLSYRTANDQTG